MKNLRTHMWISFTIGAFLMISLLLLVYVLTYFTEPFDSTILTPSIIKILIINLSLYIAYFLTVIFLAIKYVPSKA